MKFFAIAIFIAAALAAPYPEDKDTSNPLAPADGLDPESSGVPIVTPSGDDSDDATTPLESPYGVEPKNSTSPFDEPEGTDSSNSTAPLVIPDDNNSTSPLFGPLGVNTTAALECNPISYICNAEYTGWLVCSAEGFYVEGGNCDGDTWCKYLNGIPYCI
ncbi:hypothetical protein F5Y06DRAFT_304663 [Hypoxylon sp. FL0890]|nr:hypothetical protein F5Y06DRAFT_304663 [Hypoxylon sp. FL0890]